MIFGLVFCPLSHPKRNDIGGGTRVYVTYDINYESQDLDKLKGQLMQTN